MDIIINILISLFIIGAGIAAVVSIWSGEIYYEAIKASLSCLIIGIGVITYDEGISQTKGSWYAFWLGLLISIEVLGLSFIFDVREYEYFLIGIRLAITIMVVTLSGIFITLLW